MMRTLGLMRTLAALTITFALGPVSSARGDCPDAMSGSWTGTLAFRDEPLAIDLDVNVSPRATARASFPELVRYEQPLKIECEAARARLSLPFGLGDALLDISDGQLAGTSDIGAELSMRAATPRTLRRTHHEIAEVAGESVMGTLVRPDSSGPFPLVLVLAGSGNPVRANAGYAGWADWFAHRGFAAFVYDRPTDEVELDGRLLTIADHAALVIQALNRLGELSDIRSDGAGLFGRSRGAWIAFEAAGNDARFAWLAGTGSSALGAIDQNLAASRQVLANAELSASERADAMAVQTLHALTAENPELWPRLAAALANRKEVWADLVNQPRDPEDLGWFAAHASHRPADAIAQLDVPVFLAWGANDRVTPAETNQALFEVLLPPEFEHELHIYPGVGHGLEGPLNTDGDEEIVWSGTSPAFIVDLERWLARRMPTAPTNH